MEKQITQSGILMGFVCFLEAQTVFDRAQGAFQGTGHRYEISARATRFRANVVRIRNVETHQNHLIFLLFPYIYVDSITFQRFSS